MDLFGPGLRTHEESGAIVWGNQASSWHVGGLRRGMDKQMYRIYGSEDRFPKHATFGDGSPIPVEDIRHIQQALQAEEVVFPWQTGDVLLCDNHRVAHGRRPFQGERRVLVALA